MTGCLTFLIVPSQDFTQVNQSARENTLVSDDQCSFYIILTRNGTDAC